jgi:signal transduction histidine kinase
MHPLIHRRSRSPILWVVFTLAAIATAVAVHRLYSSVRRELSEQGERALQQERTRVHDRGLAYTDEVRRSTVEELAGLHVDGLDHTLRQWDEANDLIVGTFQWDPARGYLPGFGVPPGGPDPAELAKLWQEFRAWRASHPAATSRGPATAGPFLSLVYRTIDNPALPANRLGYQGENLEILAHAGRPVDPWAGWAGRDDNPAAPWVFWYQAGPDAPVRGCLFDVAPVVRQLRSELSDTSYARLDLVAAPPPGAAGGPPRPAAPLEWLPAYRLAAGHGDIFVEKESSARLTALTVALLFGLFLAGGAMLAIYTRRESRDAERKITFVAQVSHELRTPLTSIRMFADMLAAPELPEAKRARFATHIRNESLRLGALIERLLAFNVIERGGARIACRPVDVAAVIRETVEEMDAALRGAGLKSGLDLPPVPAFAMSDHSTLKQALLNLLDNAIKYAGDGGSVHIRLTADADSVRLRFADRGPGIPRAIRSRLFEPFVQGGRTLTDKTPGVGLGLSIARGMLRQTGGDIVLLASETGAAFEIRLPRAEPDHPTPP